MNLLEAFHFIFEADASNLKTGLQSAEKDNEKLKKGVEETDKSALKLGETFLAVAKSAAALFAGVVSVGALTAMSSEIASQTNELADQAKQLNVNAGALFDWQNAVIASGGTAEGFNGTLANLNKSTRDPQRALLQMSDTFKQLSSYRALKLGEALGIDPGTAELLRKGRDGVKELLAQQRELGTVDARLIEVSAKYRDSLRDTNRVYDDVKRQLAIIILPIMTKWLDILRAGVSWMRDHKPFVIGFFAAIAGIITAVYLPAMLRAVAATYALLAPYIAVGAAIAALAALIALLADDVYNFLEGNNSLIGELSKTWPAIGQLVRDTAEEIKYLLQVCRDLWAFMVLMFNDPQAAWDKFKGSIVNGLTALGEKFPMLKPLIRELQTAFEMCAKGVGTAWEVVQKVLNTIMNTIGLVTDGIGKAYDKIAGWLGKAKEAGEDVQERNAATRPEDQPVTSGLYRQEGSQSAYSASKDQESRRQDRYGPDYDENAPAAPARPAADNAEQVPQNAQANPFTGNYRGEGSQPAYDSEADQLTRGQVQRDDRPETIAPPSTADFIQQNTVNMSDDSGNRAPAPQQPTQTTVNVQSPSVTVQPAIMPQVAPQTSHSTIGEKKADKLPAAAPKSAPPLQMQPQGQQQMAQIVQPAKQQVAAMGANPINQQSSAVIANAGRQQATRQTDIRIDTIEVNTQATDADGISEAIEGSMQRQFANTTADFDDGLLA